MKFELDLVRRGKGEFVDETIAAQPRTTLIISTRRAIRMSTDDVISIGLKPDSMDGLIRTLCRAMLDVAHGIDDFDAEPGLEDFIEASIAHIEQGRSVMDRGLTLDDAATIKCGAVMIEITVRGICAALSIPYDEALRAVHEGREPPKP